MTADARLRAPWIIRLRDRWHDRRNRWLMDPRFQRAAAAFLPTRPLARREARELFDIVAGFAFWIISLCTCF